MPLNQHVVDVNERIGKSDAIVAEQSADSDSLRAKRVPMDRVDSSEHKVGSSDCVDEPAVAEDDSVWINDEGNVTEKVIRNKRRTRRPAYLNLYISRVYTRMFNLAGEMEWPKGLKRECNVCGFVCDSVKSYNRHRHTEIRRECAPAVVPFSRPTTTSAMEALEGTGAVAPARHEGQRPPSGSARKAQPARKLKPKRKAGDPRLPIRRVMSESDSEPDSAARVESPVQDISPERPVIKAAVIGPPAAVSHIVNLQGIHRVPSPRIREAALNVLLVSSTECCSFSEIASIVSRCNPDTSSQSVADLSDGAVPMS